MLTYAFAQEIIDRIKHEPFRTFTPEHILCRAA